MALQNDHTTSVGEFATLSISQGMDFDEKANQADGDVTDTSACPVDWRDRIRALLPCNANEYATLIMSPEQKELVRQSWINVLPIQETAAELFYERLFACYPEVAPLFKDDMQEQGQKLMKMLDRAVGSLDDMDALTEPLKQSGRAHRAYGVKEEDYAKVADCLLWTLEQGLGEAFDEKTREAWSVTYASLSGLMIEGADYQRTIPAATPRRPWFMRLLARATA